MMGYKQEPTANLLAKEYGVKADAQFCSGLTTTNGSTTVFSWRATFVPSDVGKIVFGTTAVQDVDVDTSVIAVPQGVITAVLDPHTATVSVAATTSITNGYIAWGSDDGPALELAWKTADALRVTLELPSGAMFTSRGLFNTATVPFWDSLFLRRGGSILGQGFNATFIIPLPNFDWTTCGGGLDGNGGSAFLGAINMMARHFTICGLGQSALGSSASGKYGVLMSGGFPGGPNFVLDSVYLTGWGGATPNFIGLNIGAPGGDISNGFMDLVNVEGFGSLSTVMNIDQAAVVSVSRSMFSIGTSNSVKLISGRLSSHGCCYGYVPNSTADVVWINGGKFLSYGDFFGWPTGYGSAQIRVDNGGLAVINGAIVAGGSTKGIVVSGTGSKLILSASQVNAAVPANSIMTDNNAYVEILDSNDIGGTTFASGSGIGTAVYANNAAALSAGLQRGQTYRTGADPDPLMIVH